jgi:ABC-type lipoprotein release transport system permease subunit
VFLNILIAASLLAVVVTFVMGMVSSLLASYASAVPVVRKAISPDT